MKTELLVIGTELLSGRTVDTNSTAIAKALQVLGIEVERRTTVGDQEDQIIEAIHRALESTDSLIATGGLGPTIDDRTTQAVVKALGLKLVLHQESLERIKEFFKRFGRPMTEAAAKQAYLPESAEAIPNNVGTAPGFIVEKNGKLIIVLPGVPAEMESMLEQTVIPFLQTKSSAEQVIKSKTLKFVGIGESDLQELLKDILKETPDVTIAFYPRIGEVHLSLTGKAKSQAQADRIIKAMEEKIRAVAGEYIFTDDERELEEVIGNLLTDKGLTLAVAESCTGGLLGNRITNVSGSSNYFMMGVVSYSNEAKMKLLGVPAGILSKHGAVSAETAEAMAKGIRKLAGTDLGVSITGIAGPTGGTPKKPVGLVFIALDAPEGTICEEHRFGGIRTHIKYRSTQAALNLIRKYLLKKG